VSYEVVYSIVQPLGNVARPIERPCSRCAGGIQRGERPLSLELPGRGDCPILARL